MANKKTHEEIVKQINIKQEFADKIYKKMRADRYGLTFCCPNELERINIKNYSCDWQDIKLEQYEESYAATMIQDPGVVQCAPPAVYNPNTGLCEASVTPVTIGSNTYSQANADPNGTPNPVVYENLWRFGKECPIIFDSINSLTGSGGNPTLIGSTLEPNVSWWIKYDATPGGAQHNPNIHGGVTETSLVNALAKEPTNGWPNNTTLEFAVPITVATTKTYYVLLTADNHFGITLDGVDLITLSDSQTAATMLNQAAAIPSNAPITSLPGDCFKLYKQYGTGSYAYTRAWLYPVDITAGCHTLVLRGRNDTGRGMFGFMVLDNTRTEIINSTSRDDLTEITASDTVNNFYTNISPTTPWSCTPPAVLYTGAPFSESCPGCQTQLTSTTFECPDGFTLNGDICEGTVESCDTETLLITVINQNREVMPFYDIVFDGGNYTTSGLGEVVIVIENASINTQHTFNLSCECITTSGGCAVQQIIITVTDPNIETCTYPDLPCECIAPSFIGTETMTSNIDGVTKNVTLTFMDANYMSQANPITSLTYTLYWRNTTDTTWNEVTGLTASSGIITYTLNSLPEGTYEYKIKSICEDGESSWSATNTFVIKITILRGCMSTKAVNYYPGAQQDDGSCVWVGCTNPNSSNFFAPAGPWTEPGTGITGTVIDDGSCITT